ncbi:MAG: phage holin family protein [Bifidobacteriaceae bacterium]|jgi:hypothetical protein|nr:phage holin family protein [Bifidobacteriaceae bacterium]
MAERSLGETLSRAATQIEALGRTTAAVVKAHLSKDGARIGVSLALFAAALVAVIGMVPLLTLALVWGLVDLGLRPWAAHLITAGVALAVAFGLALAGKALVKKAGSSLGQSAAAVKGSLAALRGGGDSGGQPDGATRTGTPNGAAGTTPAPAHPKTADEAADQTAGPAATAP